MNSQRSPGEAAFKKVLAPLVVLCSLVLLLILPYFSKPYLSTATGQGEAEPVYMPIICKPRVVPRQDFILISEVFYDPPGAEPDGEWIEIVNAGYRNIDLSQYKIGDAAYLGDKEGMLQFPPGTVITSEQVIVVANRADVYFQYYGRYPDFEMVDSMQSITDMVRYTAWGSREVVLTNTGDEVVLLDGGDQLVDAFSWGDSTFAFSPPAARVSEGSSSERYPPYIDTDTARDWRSCQPPRPGSVDLTIPTLTPTPKGTQPPSNGTPDPIINTPGQGETPDSTASTSEVEETPTPDPTPTKTPIPNLVLNEIHARPHSFLGDANQDGSVNYNKDEFIEIVNAGSAPVNISGWTLHNSNRKQHTFPENTVIQPGCAVVIFGGSPNYAGNFGCSLVQAASTSYLGLDDYQDSVMLRDLTGANFFSYSYSIQGTNTKSLTRSPDITGTEPLVFHPEWPVGSGKYYSAGVKIDGSMFEGCTCQSEAGKSRTGFD